MTQREGGWWPRGRPRWESPRRTVVEEVLLVVAVVLSLVVGVLAAAVVVLAASVVVQSVAGAEVTARLGVQLVAWGLLVVLVLSLPFVLVAAVVALTEFGEGRAARRRLHRGRPPVAATRPGARTPEPTASDPGGEAAGASGGETAGASGARGNPTDSAGVRGSGAPGNDAGEGNSRERDPDDGS